MKGKKIYFIISLVLFISLLLVLYFNFDVQTIEFDLVVGQHIGFNLDTDKLHFGTIPPGNYADRDISLTSTKKSKITIIIEGVDFIQPSINNFLILPGEKKTITLIVSVPGNAKQHVYEGKIKIYSRSI